MDFMVSGNSCQLMSVRYEKNCEDKMTFPDQIHIEKIREALWKHPKPKQGTAAIMVGAGFSKNAVPVSLSSRPMRLGPILPKNYMLHFILA